MMTSPTGSAAGPMSGFQGTSWWVESWKSYIAAGLAVVEAFFGLLAAISISPTCMVSGIFQIIAALFVLALEAPQFVAFLSFAQPAGQFFENKPHWMRAAAFACAAIIPIIPGCFSFSNILGFLAGLAIAGVYGMLVLGKKASRDEMKFQATGSPTGFQEAYPATSP